MNDIERYKERRRKRIEKKYGKRVDEVEEFKKRRSARMEERMDAGVGWAYGLAKAKGIDTEGMSPKEVFEALEEKGGVPKSKSKEINGAKKVKETHYPGPTNKKSKTRNHECDGSEYKGKPGSVESGINGNLKPKSEASKKIGTSDAMNEMKLFRDTNGKKGRARNSLYGHVDKDGNLTPERQKVHDEIVQKFFAKVKPYDGKATMTMSGGGPASGKSFIEDSVRKNFGDDTTITVDPDKLKELLPGYTDMALAGDDAAPHYHEESSALAKRIYQYALDNNINVVYDGTGDGSVGSVEKKIKAARAAGYKVKGQYVTVDVDGPTGALFRNQKRYESAKRKFENGESDVPPRLPRSDMVRGTHAKVSDIVPKVAALYDEFELWDNNQELGKPRTLIATCKSGKDINVENGDLMNRFLGKGEEGYRYKDGKISR